MTVSHSSHLRPPIQSIGSRVLNSASANTDLANEATEFSSLHDILPELNKALASFTLAQQKDLAPHIDDLPIATYIDEDEQENDEKIDDNNNYRDHELQALKEKLTAMLSIPKNEQTQAKTKSLIQNIYDVIRLGNEELCKIVLPNENTFLDLDIAYTKHYDLINVIKTAIDHFEHAETPSIEPLQQLMKDANIYLQYQAGLISKKRQQLEAYRSPDSEEKLIAQRQFFNQVAFIAVKKIEEKIESKPLPDKKTTDGLNVLQSKLKSRLANRSKLVGEKSSELRHDSPDNEKSELIKILSDFLETTKLSSYLSLDKIWNEARAEVLDQGRDWKIIDCEFMVHEQLPQITEHIEKTDSPRAPIDHRINTKTTPIGHILNDETVKIGSSNSPLSSKDCADYKINSIIDDKKITAGRHSHAATEHLHAVNAAKTECAVNGRVVFKALRHATISPYQLTQKAFKEMSEKKQSAIITDLTKDRSGITEIISEKTLHESDNAKLNSTTAPSKEVTEPKTTLETLWENNTQNKLPQEIGDMAKNDPEFFSLVRRRAALNRAREVFVSSIMSDLTLSERIKNGQPIDYNSISLLTPSPLGKFHHKLKQMFGMDTRGTASHDELTMTEDQRLAWEDLQDEIANKRLMVDGQPVKATINVFTFGVNTVSVGTLTEKLVNFLGYLERAIGGPISILISEFKYHISNNDNFLTGWETIKPFNEKALKNMLGYLDPSGSDAVIDDFKNSQLGRYLKELEEARSSSDNPEILQQRIDTVKILAQQLREMWQAEAYRSNSISPYELTSRIAVMSSMMNAGTAGNCKSGKDRTAQLIVEAEFLAFQIETKQGKVPDWREEYKIAEKTQFANFIFYDESRRTMQEYNTGVGGTKVNANFDLFFKKFLVSPRDEPGANQIKREFIGLSKQTKS